MKKTLFLCFALAAGLSGRAANSLLTSPVTAALGHSKLMGMTIASNGKDAALVLTDNKFFYALDIADNDPKELVSNAIDSIPDFVNSKLKPLAGGATLSIVEIEVNPISRAVYVLANSTTGTSYVFKVRNKGTTITLLNLSSISHSKMAISGTFSVNDMTWGENKLFASSGTFALDGLVATVNAPFVNGASVAQKSTSMFKSNWGGVYETKAPLETMTYGMVKGKHRLMGVTTCAPGFSMETSGVSGTGLVQVTEDFNMNMGMSRKVVFMRHDGKDWLFDLHDTKLYRIGETMLDGSQVAAGKYNKTSVMLRSNTGSPAAGLSSDVIRQASGTYSMISFWDDYRMLVLRTNGTLRMLQYATSAPGLSVDEAQAANNNVRVYPNPAQQTLYVELPEAVTASLQVYGMDGRLVKTVAATGTKTTVDISGMAAGQYLLKAVTADGNGGQQIFLVQ